MLGKQKITLATQDWHWQCGDGCCDEYGQRLFVDGKQLDADIYMNAHDAIEKVLIHLGYEVEWEDLNSDDTQ